MDVFDAMLKPMKEFSKNSYRLVNKCRKPDARGAPPAHPPRPPPRARARAAPAAPRPAPRAPGRRGRARRGRPPALLPHRPRGRKLPPRSRAPVGGGTPELRPAAPAGPAGPAGRAASSGRAGKEEEESEASLASEEE